MPAAASSCGAIGMSWPMSCSCRLIVFVEMTVRALLRDGVQRRRHEVRQRLADAGARLDDQLAAFGDRLADRARHHRLLAALFELLERFARGGGRQERRRLLAASTVTLRRRRRLGLGRVAPAPSRSRARSRRARRRRAGAGARCATSRRRWRSVQSLIDAMRSASASRSGGAGGEPLAQREEHAHRRFGVGHRAVAAGELDAEVVGDARRASAAGDRRAGGSPARRCRTSGRRAARPCARGTSCRTSGSGRRSGSMPTNCSTSSGDAAEVRRGRRARAGSMPVSSAMR